MKCEICHEAEAATAITREANGSEEELYVCKACAEAERKNRQKRSQRTRKPSGSKGVSITVHKGGEPPPFLHELMNVMNDIVEDIEKVTKGGERDRKPAPEPEPEKKYKTYPLSRIDAQYRIGRLIHLEGIFLIGDLPAVQRALHALDMQLVGQDCDGIAEPGHAYKLAYSGASDQARRVIADLLTQEKNARARLHDETPRIFGDAISRALAILKNCRMLSAAEQYDLLSPLRIAAQWDLLDGINLIDIDALTKSIDLSGEDEKLEIEVRDNIDGMRADEMNKRFEDVVFNERAEERFL